LSDIGISKIWALLAAPEEVAAEVVEENDVADMSVRELKDEISRLKEEKEETDKEKDELAEAKKKQDKEQARLDASLAKAKEDLKKAKEKLDKMKADQSGEIQKAVEEKTAEAVKRVREENAESIKGLSEQIERLEEEKAKLSNTSVMEFRFLIDQLQDTYFKASDLIAKQRVQDEETAEKMKAALKKIIEGWE
jgi:chromosome segregation ATPase